MTPVEIGLISVVAIVVLIYVGVYIAVALGMVSFIAIWLMRDNIDLAFALTKIAIGDSVMEYTFATIPLFVFMGLIVSKAGLGADIYAVMNQGFRRITGGIGMATVGANAVFAAVTGSSIASASVFSKMSVPEMLRHKYNPRFAVGVVAGSSVLGMIIPPSAMLIIYSFVAEQSVGEMFLAGVIPGLLLAFAYVVAIWFMGRFTPGFVGGEIIEEGDFNMVAYIVEAGEAEVVVGGKSIASVSAGEMIGEVGFFSRGAATATVRAKTEMTVLSIPYNRIDVVLEENPAMLRAIAEELADRLRAMDARQP